MESYHMYEETGLVSASALAIYKEDIRFSGDEREQSPDSSFLCVTPNLIVFRELHHPQLLLRLTWPDSAAGPPYVHVM